MTGAGRAEALPHSLPMVDDQTRAATLAAAIILQQHALSLQLLGEMEHENLDTLGGEETDGYSQQTDIARQIMHLGSLIPAVTATLPSPGPTVRGSYNQYAKCTQFIGVSMGWPDRQFRHEYRSVGIFHVAILDPELPVKDE